MRCLRFISLAALGAMTLTATGHAQESKPAKADEKIICKGERSLEFGSHRRAKKVCMTESEWKLLEKGTQRELQAFRERSQTHGDNRGR